MNQKLVVLASAVLFAACGPKAETTTTSAAAAPKAAESYAFAAPIAPGQTDTWKAFAAELAGAKKDAHTKANLAAGITNEKVWLQETPMGAFVVVYHEGSDLKGSMQKRAAATDEHSKWFMSQVEKIHGMKMDPSHPMPANELAFNGNVDVAGGTPYALIAPIVKGKEAQWKQVLSDISGPKKAEWEASRKALGIHKEMVWLQKTPMGDVAVVYFDAKDPSVIMAPPKSDFDKWFMTQLTEVHGFKMDGPAPKPNQMMLNAGS